MRGLDWRTLHLPLAAGLNQKADARALQPPELEVAKDVQFEEVGGLQTRKPFAATGGSIFGGGSLSTARRIAAYGNERVLFTKDTIYSWNDALDVWVAKGTHLAVAVDEQTAYATTGDQRDCDRAELAGTVLVAWVDAAGLWVAASDKATGSVLMAPTLANAAGTRPRLVALSTRILLFWIDSAANDLEVISIAPDAPASAVAGAATTVLAASNLYYDVVRMPGADSAVGVIRRSPTTSYEVFGVTAGLSVANVTKGRTCDGPIAISVEPAGVYAQVIRGNGTNIQGDYIEADAFGGASDVTTGQAIGTAGGTLSQIAAAHRSVQDGGFYRCYVFWTDQESTGATDWQSRSNYVDTGGTIGTAATFVRRLGLGSRAFDHDGRIFIWGVFAGESSFSGASSSNFRAQLQNSYFLYRDDASLHAKAVFQRGGGLQPSAGRLPGVALTSGTTTYSWCATERRVIPVGTTGEQLGVDKRAPRDVTFEFDSNRARRCARLGDTLYVTSGEGLLQYDGVGLYEVGFHVYPWYFGAIEVATGDLEDGTYTFKVTWRWENARGELDRSTTATHGDVTISGGPNGVSIVSWVPLYITHKTNRPIAVEVWRTAKDPQLEAPFFLVTSKDPAAGTNPNRYIPNDTTASLLATFNDELADADGTDNESNPENGDLLENLAPPPATLIAATDTRLFLAGVAGDPDRVWYSKLRAPGQVAAFHDSLAFNVPLAGGAITGLALLAGILIVFREAAIYMFPGEGQDNHGAGEHYGPPQILSSDVGCRDTDSIAVTPEGVVFQSSKGKYLLTRGFQLRYIGGPVVDYDSETVVAAHVVEAQHQVRWLTGSRLLVFDYLVEQWAEWSIAGGVHAAIWDGTYHYLTASGPQAEQSSYASLTYGLDVETAWIKPANLQGAVRVRWLELFGEYRSAHHLRVRVYFDGSTTAVDDKFWTPSPTTVGGPLQLKILPSRQQCQSIKLRITAVDASNHSNPPSGEALKLTGLGLELGFKPGLFRRLPAAQRA